MVLTKRPDNIQRKLDEVADYTGHYWPGDTALGVSLEGRLGFWPPQIWLGVTAENQETADERIPVLLDIPAAVRFVSVEPMLAPISLTKTVCLGCGKENCGTCPAGTAKQFRYDWADTPGAETRYNWPLDGVICGGESGPGARPMHPDWPRGLRDQCQSAGVPFFFKQWGEWAEFQDNGPSMAPGSRVQQVFYVRRNGRVHPNWEHNEDACMGKVGKKDAGRLLDGREWNELPGSDDVSQRETR